MEEGHAAIVVDNGSDTCKAGLASDPVPSSIFPSVVGRLRHPGILLGGKLKPHYVGEEAQQKRGVLVLRRPVERGVIVNWDDMELLWHDLFFHQLKASPEEHPVLLSEPPFNPIAHREKMTELMFELFRTSLMNVALQPMLSLYSAGLTTGLVVDCGHETLSTTAIYEGKLVATPGAMRQSESANGGHHLTKYLKELLAKERGFALDTSAEWEYVRDIKEKLCYVAAEFDGEMQLAAASYPCPLERHYELPSGEIVTIDTERFRVPEALFQPALLASDCSAPSDGGGTRKEGIHEMTNASILQCEPSIRQQLYRGIVLSGGTSLFAGMAPRLRHGVLCLADAMMDVRVVASAERQFSVWQGGAALAAVLTSQQKWISRKEYEEEGTSVIHRKLAFDLNGVATAV
ncbi:actin [Balamuthia mandrillaris]